MRRFIVAFPERHFSQRQSRIARFVAKLTIDGHRLLEESAREGIVALFPSDVSEATERRSEVLPAACPAMLLHLLLVVGARRLRVARRAGDVAEPVQRSPEVPLISELPPDRQ